MKNSFTFIAGPVFLLLMTGIGYLVFPDSARAGKEFHSSRMDTLLITGHVAALQHQANNLSYLGLKVRNTRGTVVDSEPSLFVIVNKSDAVGAGIRLGDDVQCLIEMRRKSSVRYLIIPEFGKIRVMKNFTYA